MTVAQPSSTLRERRRVETREHIRSVALALVRERSYDAVTVDLISERAGVSVRTFFNYFVNKESAMIAVPPPLPESAVQEFLTRRGTDDLFADLAELAVAMFERAEAGPSTFQESIQIVMTVPTLAKLQFGALAERETEFVDIIAERLAVHSDDEHAAVIAAAFTGSIGVACRRWSSNPERQRFSEQVRACVTILSTS